MLEYLFAYPILACFEGENEGGDDDTGNDDPVKKAEDAAAKAKAEADKKAAEARQAAETAAKAREKAFSQDDVNRFLADDRRKHQEKYQQLEDSYKSMLDDKSLAVEQREKLATDLKELQKAFRTKEEQAEFERRQQQEQYEAELTKYKEDASTWEQRYKDGMVQRSLQDAAVAAEAFSPRQIMALLGPMTKVTEDVDEITQKPTGEFKAMVDFEDVDDKGERVISLRTPTEAVERMKQLPQLYGNLFRANVASGIGSGAASGGISGDGGGKVDVTKLSAEQYRKLRKDNPAALGLRRKP